MSAELLEYSAESEGSQVTELEALGTAPIGVAVTSLAGSLRYANDAFGLLFNASAVHVGGDIHEITRGLLQEEFLMSVAREGGTRQIVVTVDEHRVLLCTAKRVMHGPFPIYLSVVVQDISDLAGEYVARWQVLRQGLGGSGVAGPWNWTMLTVSTNDVCSNPVTWLSADAGAFGAGFEPKTFGDLLQRVQPHCRGRVLAEVSRAIETRGSYCVDYELMGRDGSLRYMRSMGCCSGSEHSTWRLIGVEVELQARQPEEHRDGICRTLLEQMEVPVLSIDRRLRYRYFNSAFETFARSVGDHAVQIDEPVLGAVTCPGRRRRLADVLARVMKGEPSIYESEFADDRGEVYQWVDFHFKPTRDASGAIDGAVAVGYDVSPLKRANRYQKSLSAELRQRLEHRMANIDAANRDLSNRVASACDHLRRQLQEIRAMIGVEAAAASGTENSPPHIPAALAGMAAQIDALEELSDIALRRPEWRRIDMNRLIREILRDLGPMVEGRSVQFDIESLPHVVADRTLVRQVLFNLLSNAIKFTRGCPAPRVRVWATATENGATTWSVADNGIGFDTKKVDEMFGAFVRRGTKPQGVGLSVAWRAIQQLDGRLWCESSPGQGATFRFTIGKQELEA
jgi:signal transduction histidine kinase